MIHHTGRLNDQVRFRYVCNLFPKKVKGIRKAVQYRLHFTKQLCEGQNSRHKKKKDNNNAVGDAVSPGTFQVSTGENGNENLAVYVHSKSTASMSRRGLM